MHKLSDFKKRKNLNEHEQKIDGEIFFIKHNKDVVMRNITYSKTEVSFSLEEGAKYK